MKKPTVRYSIRLSEDLNRTLEEICLRRRGLTKKGIIEAALKEYLYPEGEDKRALEFSRFLERVERRVKGNERYLEIVGETLSLFVRVWLTQTRELPEEQQELAKVVGGKRYRRFLEILGQNLRNGKTIFEELPEEVLFGKDAFFSFKEGSAEGVATPTTGT